MLTLHPQSPKAHRAAELTRELLTAAGNGNDEVMWDTLARILPELEEDPDLLVNLLVAQARHCVLAVGTLGRESAGLGPFMADDRIEDAIQRRALEVFAQRCAATQFTF